MKTAGLLASSVLALTLTACGGGGGGGSPTANPGDGGFPETPATERLSVIAQHTNSLLVPSTQSDVTIRVQGQSETIRTHERFNCVGVRCSGVQTGIFIDLDAAQNIFAVPRNVRLGRRAGFDTATYSVNTLEATADVLGAIPGLRIDRLPQATGWGFWGDYGVGEVSTSRGDFSGRYDGVSFNGRMSTVASLTAGEASGTNPVGIGSASWEGIAEAASLRSYTRRQGTASIFITDLSNPMVDVDVRIDGRSIGSSAWNNIPLERGDYGTGIVGRDYLRGKFHGPAHEETYGVFDTGTWAGAFGAKRE